MHRLSYCVEAPSDVKDWGVIRSTEPTVNRVQYNCGPFTANSNQSIRQTRITCLASSLLPTRPEPNEGPYGRPILLIHHMLTDTYTAYLVYPDATACRGSMNGFPYQRSFPLANRSQFPDVLPPSMDVALPISFPNAGSPAPHQPQINHNHTRSSLTPTQPETSTGASPVATNTRTEYTSTGTSIDSRNNLLPLILAPILAVFGLAGLLFVWYYLYKRRKARRVAPSTEFKNYERRSVQLAGVEAGSVRGGVAGGRWSFDESGEKLERENSNRALLAFAPGFFKDPILKNGVAISLANQRGAYSAAG